MSEGPIQGFFSSIPKMAGTVVGLLIAASIVQGALQPYLPIIGKVAAIALIALILIVVVVVIVILIRIINYFRGGGHGGGLHLGGWD